MALHRAHWAWTALLALLLIRQRLAKLISKEALYVELACQARTELAAMPHLSAHSSTAHFRSAIAKGFVRHGHSESAVEVLIQSWHRHNATAFGNRPLPFQHEFPRTVWLLWLAGWESAPWVVREVAALYERHNPGWSIVRLDNTTLRDYVEIDYIDKPNIEAAAKADILRIALLAEHGGVWADATVLCCYAPLDSWIHGALIPQDFWMYHARDGGKRPSSWFLATTKGSHLMQSWKAAVDAYWGARDWMHDYFWMDSLFKDLMDWDPNFLAQWQQVPYMYGEAEGQSAMLPWHSMTSNDAHIKQLLHKKPPYVLKLSHHPHFPMRALRPPKRRMGTLPSCSPTG